MEDNDDIGGQWRRVRPYRRQMQDGGGGEVVRDYREVFFFF